MAIFKKKKKDDIESVPELPELPELPKLSDFNDRFKEDEDMEPSMMKTNPKKINPPNLIPQLPRFPASSTGDRFSQSTIKEAIGGEKEVEDEANDFDSYDEEQMMPTSPRKTMKFGGKGSYQFMTRKEPKESSESSNEPVFVRIDHFEESLKIFEDTKKQVVEIEKLLESTREIKEREEQTLQKWENELQNIKNKIERINRDLFSKI